MLIMVHQLRNQFLAFLNITQEVEIHLQLRRVKVGKAIKNNIHHLTLHPQFQQKKGSQEILRADINIPVWEAQPRCHNQMLHLTVVLRHSHYMDGIETVPFLVRKSVNVVEVRRLMTATN